MTKALQYQGIIIYYKSVLLLPYDPVGDAKLIRLPVCALARTEQSVYVFFIGLM